MKIVVAVLIAFFLVAPGWAQSGSVWVEDYSAEAMKVAGAAGKTTLIYYGGSSLAVANHIAVARYVAQRVAEELTNALVLPIISDGPEAYGVVNRTITAGGFKNVMIMGDDGPPSGDMTLESVARKLDLEWQTKGVRIYYIHAHEIRPGQGMTLNIDYLRRWAARTVAEGRRQSVENYAELLFVDRDHRWLRPDMIPPEDRAVVNPTLGKVLVETRVTSILDQIRQRSPSHVR